MEIAGHERPRAAGPWNLADDPLPPTSHRRPSHTRLPFNVMRSDSQSPLQAPFSIFPRLLLHRVPAGPTQLVSGPTTLTYNNESGTVAFDKSDMALLDIDARQYRKVRCATGCHSSGHACHRADPLYLPHFRTIPPNGRAPGHKPCARFHVGSCAILTTSSFDRSAARSRDALRAPGRSMAPSSPTLRAAQPPLRSRGRLRSLSVSRLRQVRWRVCGPGWIRRVQRGRVSCGVLGGMLAA